MKTFGYTFRDREGALKSGSLQAVDRLEALRQIKERGCIPVAVTECKGVVAGTRAPWNPASWNRAVWGSVAAGVVLIAALSVWLTTDKKTAPRPAPVTAAAGTPPRGGRSAPPARTAPSAPSARPAPLPAVSDTTSHTQAAAPAPRAPSSAPAVASPLKPAEEPAPPEEPKRPAPFKTGTEQILAIIKSTPPGVQMPPLPELTGMEDDFARASTNTLEIYDTDSDELAKKIESVAWAKVELSDLVKQGWKPDDVLTELTRQHNEEASLRTAATLALKRMVDSGELSAAALKSELQLINKELAERGLPEINYPELGVVEE